MTIPNKIIYLLIILLSTLGSSLKAQQHTITLSNDEVVENISESIQYYEDEWSQKTIAEIIQLDSLFVINGRKYLHFDDDNTSYWFAITLNNKSDKNARLELNLVRMDTLQMWAVDKNKRITKTVFFNGKQTYAETKWHSTYPTFEVPAKSLQTYYFRIRTRSMMNYSINLYGERGYLSWLHLYSMLYGAYYGITLLIGLYGIIFGFYLRDNLFFLYALSVLMTGFSVANLTGHSFEFIWAETPYLQAYSPSVILLTMVANLNFAILFLKKPALSFLEKKTLPFLYFFIGGIIVINLAGLLNISIFLTHLSSFFVYFYILFLTIRSYAAGFQPARFFIAAWATYAVASLLFTLSNFFHDFYILPFLDFLPITAGIEVLLSAMALSNKLRIEQLKTQALKLSNEEILKKQNETLEEKIRERIEEIKQQQEEIISQRDEIREKQLNLEKNLRKVSTQNAILEKAYLQIQQKKDIINQQKEELEIQREKLNEQYKIIEKQNTQLRKDSELLEKSIKTRTQELAEANTELLRQNNQLEEFAHITSHNLRAPVASLLGLVYLLEYEHINPEQYKDIIQRIGATTASLDQVMHDLNYILDIKKGMHQNYTWVSFGQLLEEVKEMLKEEIENSQARIMHQLSAPDQWYTIAPYLKSILFHLLSNAIKYRKNQRDTLIKVSTEMQSEKKILLTIVDNGIGIDIEKFQAKIFGLYQRFHTHKEGRGLGLYLVKNQVEAMNGSIEIQSELNQGTTFIISFMIKEAFKT